jgi:hypothetical protein
VSPLAWRIADGTVVLDAVRSIATSLLVDIAAILAWILLHLITELAPLPSNSGNG